MKITINSTLSRPRQNRPQSKQDLINKYSRIKVNYRENVKTQELLHVENDLNGTHFHQNYMEYLEIAWGYHYGVQITPDIIWHTLLSEIVQIVSEDPKKHAHLFTETPDKKQTIIIVSSDLVVMPLNDLVRAIKQLLPTNCDMFMPEFSTTTDRARMARYASFADLVSPYYDYYMLLCGIPYVDVQGTEDDWKKVLNSWQEISRIISGHEKYFQKTISLLEELVGSLKKAEFWKEMFSVQKCGSGHQTYVSGWFAELFQQQPETRYACNFSSHLAKVCYKQLNTKKEYEMYHGLLHSQLEDDFLVPDFGSIVYNKPEVSLESPYKMEIESYTIGSGS